MHLGVNKRCYLPLLHPSFCANKLLLYQKAISEQEFQFFLVLSTSDIIKYDITTFNLQVFS